MSTGRSTALATTPAAQTSARFSISSLPLISRKAPIVWLSVSSTQGGIHVICEVTQYQIRMEQK